MSQASHFFFREQQTCWNLDFFIVQFNESKFPLLSPLSLTSLTRLRASVISATRSAFDRLNCSHSPNNILESHSNIVLQVLTLQLSHLLIILLYFCKSHHFSGCSFWNTFSTSGLDACMREIRIFIARLAVFCILITERCDHAKSEDVCVAKRFFIRKAQGKSVQVQYF